MTYNPMYSRQRADFVAAVTAEVQPLVDEAQAWAEGTLPGGAGTKSAKEWSEVSEAEADAAAASAASATSAAALQAEQLSASLVRARGIAITEVEQAANFAANGIDHRFSTASLRSGFYTSTAMTSLSGVAFTRAGSAYVIDAAGAMTLVSANVARQSDKGLLIEASRTNRILWSQDFSNAVWGNADPASASVTVNTDVAPDGTTTADTLVSTGAGRPRRQNITVSASTAYEVSVFLKGGTAAQSRVLMNDSVNAVNTLINWSGGVPTIASTLGTWTATPCANGFYRFSAIYTSSASASAAQLSVIPDTSAGGGTVIAWGAQVCPGSRLSSYIPTTSATVARPADRAIYTVPTLTYPLLVFADFIAPGGDGMAISLYNSAATNNSVEIVTTGGIAYLSVKKDGAEQQNAISPWGITAGSRVRIAMLLRENDIRVCVNGGFIYTDTTATMPTGLNRVIPGGDWSGTKFLNDYIYSIMVVPGCDAPDDTLNALAAGTNWYGTSFSYGPGNGHGWFENYAYGRAYKQSSGANNNRLEMYLGQGDTTDGPEFSVRHNYPGSWKGAAIYARNHNDTDGIQITYLDPDHPALRFSDAGPFFVKDDANTASLRASTTGAFKTLKAKLATDTAATTGSVTPTKYLTLYDVNGVAYKVPCAPV